MDKVEKAKISPGQLFTLLVVFCMGTAIIRVLAIKAEKDAWLAILLGSLGGIGYLFCLHLTLSIIP